MYSVVVVDDERIIREGIIRMIEWEELGLQVIGAKQNGLEAMSFIMEQNPDIVITDIMMPEMNGLELISAIHEKLPHVMFIVLSGYGEFEFANKAMKYGVKHYILKPCDEGDITEALTQVMVKLRQREKRDRLVVQLEENWKSALPQMKERFLAESIETAKYNQNDYERYRQLFHIDAHKLQLLILRPQSDCSLLERFALKNIAEELLELRQVCISTIYKSDVLLLIQSVEHEDIESSLEEISEVYQQYYKKKLSIAISNENTFDRLPELYADAKGCVEYAFYLGEGSVITNQDVIFGSGGLNYALRQDYERIAVSIRTGHVDAVCEQVGLFFERLVQNKQRIELARTYCVELLLNMIRQSHPEMLSSYAHCITRLEGMDTLQQIEQTLLDIATQIATVHYEQTTKKYSLIVDAVLTHIQEQLANPSLSLKWLAREVLFMNEDYLGRLFQREMGERFTQYLIRTRMEKAKGMIESGDDLKLFEISELTGFGDKYHYFSLAFKKYTGMSPSEYKKLCET